jgi:opacity protein-like surface antigen
MWKVSWLLLLLTSLPSVARAGDGDPVPKAELFGGYSYFRSDLGLASTNFNGGEVSIAENPKRWFGGVLDFSSHYNGGVNITSVMYGPQVAYRRNPKWTPFAHALVGAVRGSVGYLDISKAEARIAFATGGGLDAQVTQHLAVRVIQVDYIFSHFSEVHQDNIRLSVGLVFRFGFPRQ